MHGQQNVKMQNLGSPIKLFRHHASPSLGTPDNPFMETWGSAEISLRNGGLA